MKYKFLSMSTLERIAPWADLSNLRERLLMLNLAGDKTEIEDFKNGELPTLPYVIINEDFVHKVTLEYFDGNDFVYDRYFSDALVYIKRYFLDENFWERC